MQRKVLMLVLLPVCAIGLACSGESSPKEEDDDFGGKKIPLESIYSTSRQKGLKNASAGFRLGNDGKKNYIEPYGATLGEIEQRHHGGASNMFLARGENITAVVGATWEVFLGRCPVDEPVSLGRRAKSDQLWLVAYLGVAGSGPAWLVKSVTVSGKQIRLMYEWVGTDANDELSYLAWVPLGKLESGIYVLELCEEDPQQVTLLRRVKVPKP